MFGTKFSPLVCLAEERLYGSRVYDGSGGKRVGGTLAPLDLCGLAVRLFHSHIPIPIPTLSRCSLKPFLV